MWLGRATPGNPRKMRGVADHHHRAPGQPGRSILSSRHASYLEGPTPVACIGAPVRTRDASRMLHGSAGIGAMNNMRRRNVK
jgi:hypothetical protein